MALEALGWACPGWDPVATGAAWGMVTVATGLSPALAMLVTGAGQPLPPFSTTFFVPCPAHHQPLLALPLFSTTRLLPAAPLSRPVVLECAQQAAAGITVRGTV